MDSVATVSNVLRQERLFQQNSPFQRQSRLIPPVNYNTRFISSILMSMCLIHCIPQLKQQFQESLTVMHLQSSSFHNITGISIAGNIDRLVENEQRITQFILSS